MLKLYYKPGAVSLASHIALEEAGADFEIVPIDFKVQEQRTPTYLSLNPLGRVPTLITGHGALTETLAILTYIAMAHPAAQLAPDMPWELAQMLSVMSFLASTVHVSAAHMNRGYRWADDPAAIAEMRRKAPSVVAANLRILEERVGPGPWILGPKYSAADPFLFVMTWWAEPDGVPLAPFPNLRAHLTRMQGREAVQKVLAREGLFPR